MSISLIKLFLALIPTIFIQSFASMATATTFESFYPASLLSLDQKFAHHVIVVEKSTHKLYLFKNNNSSPEFVKEYTIVTGKTPGNKFSQGDYKTPEGIYYIVDFMPSSRLLEKYGEQGKIYGAGAFVLNFPNVVDGRLQKTGSGIWLHSTDDETRLEKGLDSRGCVVANDKDLMDISQYIETDKTALIIVQDLNFVREETWKKNREEVLGVIENWKKSWQEENIEKYMSFYDREEFHDSERGNYKAYKTYKSAVFSRHGQPEINFKYVSAFSTDNYAVIQLQQEYKSQTIHDTGKKTLYLKKNGNYEWKIVAEIWHKLDSTADTTFVPSMRFFKKLTNVSK